MQFSMINDMVEKEKEKFCLQNLENDLEGVKIIFKSS